MNLVNLTINNKSVSVPKGYYYTRGSQKIKYKNSYPLSS